MGKTRGHQQAVSVDAGKKFGSATAFSIHCKRMQTPNKQGDDGWKSTLYDGQPLENYRRKYFQESGLDGEAEVLNQRMQPHLCFPDMHGGPFTFSMLSKHSCHVALCAWPAHSLAASGQCCAQWNILPRTIAYEPQYVELRLHRYKGIGRHISCCASP